MLLFAKRKSICFCLENRGLMILSIYFEFCQLSVFTYIDNHAMFALMKYGHQLNWESGTNLDDKYVLMWSSQ